MAIDDNTSYELTGYQVKDLAGRIRLKADASSVPTSISDLGQVTANDIDWTGIPEIVGTYAADGDKNYALKFPDGTLICCIVKAFGSKTFTSWGNLYGVDIASSSWGSYAVSFINTPTLNITAYATSNSSLIQGTSGAPTKTAPPGLTICRATSGSVSITGHCIAIGRWK